MNLSPFSAEVLRTLLEQEQQALSKLIALLQHEETALVNGSADDLPSIEAEKISLLHLIDKLVRQRDSAISAAGFNATPAGMESFFTAHADLTKTCYLLWADVLKLWQQAREKNRINENIARMRLRQTEGSLNALFQAAGINTTYSSDGRVQNATLPNNPLRVG